MKKLFLLLFFTIFINTNLFAVSYSSSCNNGVCEWKVSFDGISINSKMCSQYYEKSLEDLTELETAKQLYCYMQDFMVVNFNVFDDFQLYELESLVLEIFVDDLLTESEKEIIDAYKTFAFSSDRFISFVNKRESNNKRESKKTKEEKDVKKIPEGARFSTQLRGWECDASHYRNNDSTGCLKIPFNAIKLGKSNFKCNSYTRKSENKCVYYQLKSKQSAKNNLPSNAIAYADGSGWYCLYGYKKTGNSCVKNVYKKTVVNKKNNSNKSNNGPTLSEMIEACKYIGSQIKKLGFGFSNSDIGEPFELGGVTCGKHYGRFISIKSIKPPRVYIGEPGDFFGIGGDCVNYKTLKYWQVEEGKDCR